MAVIETSALPSTVRDDDYSAVLANDHRRTIVEIVAEEDRSLPRRLLAGWAAAEAEGVPLDALPERSIDRAEVKLHHVHLPKLDEIGVLNYDVEEKRIEPGDEIEAACRQLASFRAARKN